MSVSIPSHAPRDAQICFCVSLVVHDLVIEAEARLKAQPKTTGRESENDPYRLFCPRSIFTFPGKRNRSAYEGEQALAAEADLPSEEDIRCSIADIHALSRFSPGCLVVALIYIERLRRGAGALLLASTWQPTLLLAIIVAQKVWEDKPHLNVDFTRLCPALTLRQLNRLERDFLQLLDYNVGVKAAVYTEWYFRLGTLCERSSMRLRPLDGHEARALEISAGIYTSRLQAEARPSSGPLPMPPDEGSNDKPSSSSRELVQRSRAVLS